MAKKVFTAIRIDPEVKFYAEQIAEAEKRSFSNLVEFILSVEIESKKRKGFNFIKLNDASTEYVGHGPDEELAKKFKEFTDK